MRRAKQVFLHALVGSALVIGIPGTALAAPPPTATAPVRVAPPGARVAPATTVRAAVPPRVAPAPSVRVAPAATIHVTPAPSAGVAPRPAATIHLAPTPPVATVHVTPPPVATVHVTPAAFAASTPVKVPAFSPPPPGADRATLIAASKALIQRQAVRTQQLRPTSGFQSLEDIGKAVAAMGPGRAKVVELLKAEDKLEFTMRVPEQVRDSVASRGFLNQHEIGNSRGTFSPDYRANVEASFLGVSRGEYDQLPNAVRPKYGYMRPAPGSGLRMQDGAGQYGEDIFIFKRGAVKDHLTFYPTDSLGKSALSWPAKEAAPTDWHHAMHPWADRMMLAPGLDVSDAGDLVFSTQGPPGFDNTPTRNGARYLEIQIWRPLGIEEVERFEFASTPPSGEFLKALRQNGVKIIKQGTTEEWKGDHGPTSLRRFLRTSPRNEAAPLAKAA